MRLYRYVVSSFYANPDWAHVFALTFFASCEDTIAIQLNFYRNLCLQKVCRFTSKTYFGIR